MESMELTSGGVGLDVANHSPAHAWNKQDTIPDDPIAAETHYTEVSERHGYYSKLIVLLPFCTV